MAQAATAVAFGVGLCMPCLPACCCGVAPNKSGLMCCAWRLVCVFWVWGCSATGTCWKEGGEAVKVCLSRGCWSILFGSCTNSFIWATKVLSNIYNSQQLLGVFNCSGSKRLTLNSRTLHSALCEHTALPEGPTALCAEAVQKQPDSTLYHTACPH